MGHLISNQYSHLTAKERNRLSFPADLLLKKNLLLGSILDFGCGFGTDVQILRGQKLDIIGYDQYYFPEYPEVKFDTIICFYVLNVLLVEEQTKVLMEVSNLLKPSGRAYFAVRRDNKYEGFRKHKIHKKPTYQCNVQLNYKSIFKNDNCEIYEYRHWNQATKAQTSTCPFCNLDANAELIVESATAFAVYDKFPVNKGHALVIPKKHCPDYFDLTFKEQTACWFVMNKVKQIVTGQYSPDGFNVGINVGQYAGQTVPHVHLHLIPRYKDDVRDPEGGVRGVVPEKKNYRLKQTPNLDV